MPCCRCCARCAANAAPPVGDCACALAAPKPPATQAAHRITTAKSLDARFTLPPRAHPTKIAKIKAGDESRKAPARRLLRRGNVVAHARTRRVAVRCELHFDFVELRL